MRLKISNALGALSLRSPEPADRGVSHTMSAESVAVGCTGPAGEAL